MFAYLQLKYQRVHFHGMDMRDTYTYSIIIIFLEKHKMNRIRWYVQLKQQKIYLHERYPMIMEINQS